MLNFNFKNSTPSAGSGPDARLIVQSDFGNPQGLFFSAHAPGQRPAQIRLSTEDTLALRDALLEMHPVEPAFPATGSRIHEHLLGTLGALEQGVFPHRFIAGIEAPEEEPTEDHAPEFIAGDVVYLTGPHYIARGREDMGTFDEAPRGLGSKAEVVEWEPTWGEGTAVRVRWVGDNAGTSVITPDALSRAEDLPGWLTDGDGDRWTRVEGDRYRWHHGDLTQTIDEIAAEYDVQEFAPTPGAGTFATGDLVRVADGATTRDGGFVDPDVYGEVGRVTGMTEAGSVIVAFDHLYPGFVQRISAEFLAVEDGPEAARNGLRRGDRVRHTWTGYTGTVESFHEFEPGKGDMVVAWDSLGTVPTVQKNVVKI